MKMESLLLLLFLGVTHVFVTDALGIGENCTVRSATCDAGTQCSACGVCARVKPTDPKSKVNGLPFNKYSWLTTHNSFAIDRPLISNQEDKITVQLNNGVRGLMLDMYDFENDIWLCHSFGGKCYKDLTNFQPAINVLREIQIFLAANPTEIVTIFIEDYVTTPTGLTKVFDAAGLRKYWFPVTSMPKNGQDWPLITDMIAKNQRLIVFTSKRDKEATEGIAYEWNYILENQYGNGGMVPGSCPNRAESNPMNDKTRSLVLMNYFPDNPNGISSCTDNSAHLIDMLNTCHNLSSNRWANFIAVDFYKRSNGGGAPLATDTANGHMVCGCANVNFCKANATFGTCNIPPPPPPSPPPPPPPPSMVISPPRTVDNSSPCGKRISWWLIMIQYVLFTSLLLA